MGRPRWWSNGTCVKVLAWYDNEIGYVNRMVELAQQRRPRAWRRSMISVRQYAIVTAAYWAFTLTDGAFRLLVLLHFHELGYTPVQLAFLFLLYEFCGVITNLFGGWLASRTGLRFTLELGLGLQALSLGLLALLNPLWPVTLSVAYVMGCQALSGIAKDLTKMSAKSAVKVLVPKGDESGLFRWVALLTGSKNALKGVGFFLGGFLLSVLGFKAALVTMAGGIGVVLLFVVTSLPSTIGRPKTKVKFSGVFSHSAAINTLSVARIALFAARDVWFVVSVPVFLGSVLGWTFAEIGTFLALWVIGYGFIQAASPVLLRTVMGDGMPPPFLTGMLGLALSGRHRRDRVWTARGSVGRIRRSGRPRGVRSRLRFELGAPFLSRAGVCGIRASLCHRWLLLHGERDGPAARYAAFRTAVPTRRRHRFVVGFCCVIGRRRRKRVFSSACCH